MPYSLPVADVYTGLVLARKLEIEERQSLALTLFGMLRVKQDGGTIDDLAPHLFKKEDVEKAKQKQEMDREQGAQLQQLMLLKKLSEQDGGY